MTGMIRAPPPTTTAKPEGVHATTSKKIARPTIAGCSSTSGQVSKGACSMQKLRKDLETAKYRPSSRMRSKYHNTIRVTGLTQVSANEVRTLLCEASNQNAQALLKHSEDVNTMHYHV